MFECVRGHTVFVTALRGDSVIVDLGANRGEFSRQIRERVGGSCYLVECNPALAAMLEREGSFPVWKRAVSSANGFVSLHIANNDEASSVLELTAQSAHSGGLRDTVRVEANTLEALLSEMGCERVDLLKMDIEGAEVEVLRTVPASVLRRIGQITAELHGHPEFGFSIQQNVEEVVDRMRECGFISLDFSYGTRRDVLFINRALHRVSRIRELLWAFRTNPPCWLNKCWNAMPASFRDWLRSPLNRATGIDRNR